MDWASLLVVWFVGCYALDHPVDNSLWQRYGHEHEAPQDVHFRREYPDAQCLPRNQGESSTWESSCGGTRNTGLLWATRSPVLGRAAAASSHPLVSETALDMLRAGGNAVDAAIAANAMNGFVEPGSNGMGGDLMALVWHNGTRKVYGYNGSGRAPRGMSYAQLVERLKGDQYIPGKGPLPVTVPGAVEGWCRVHERFGRLPWGQLFQPTIEAATVGVPLPPIIARAWRSVASYNSTSGRYEVGDKGRYPHAVDNFIKLYAPGGHIPEYGQVFRNPELAATLDKISRLGCAEFYNGSIAATIAAWAPTVGLPLTAEDFRLHQGEWVEPISTTYRDRYEVYELPPNPQGLAALQQLNILETYNLSALPFNSADYLHLHVESKKLAFADRAKWYADPDFNTNAPEVVKGLLSKEYARQRAGLIDMQQAAKRVDAGNPLGDTVYLTTADGEGNMVSWIQSNYLGFGSGLTPPGLGFSLQDRGAGFAVYPPDHRNVYAPGKRPFHTIIPAFATKDGQPWLSFGVMGGSMQPQGHVQIICNMVDFGMNVQEAGDAARYEHTGSSQPTGYVMEDGGRVTLEGGIGNAQRESLRQRGHEIGDLATSNGGGYQAIMWDNENKVYHAASEMRKDGAAAALNHHTVSPSRTVPGDVVAGRSRPSA